MIEVSPERLSGSKQVRLGHLWSTMVYICTGTYCEPREEEENKNKLLFCLREIFPNVCIAQPVKTIASDNSARA